MPSDRGRRNHDDLFFPRSARRQPRLLLPLREPDRRDDRLGGRVQPHHPPRPRRLHGRPSCATAPADPSSRRSRAEDAGNSAVFGYGLEEKGALAHEAVARVGRARLELAASSRRRRRASPHRIPPPPAATVLHARCWVLTSPRLDDRPRWLRDHALLLLLGLEFVAKAAGDGAGDGVLTPPPRAKSTLEDHPVVDDGAGGQWHRRRERRRRSSSSAGRRAASTCTPRTRRPAISA